MKRVQVERTIEKQEKRTIEQEILWKSKKIETESEKRTSRSRATVKAEKRQIDRIKKHVYRMCYVTLHNEKNRFFDSSILDASSKTTYIALITNDY